MVFKVVSLVLVLVGGLAAALQGIINGELSKAIGLLESALITFVGGAIILGLLAGFFGSGRLGEATSVPRWQLVGGALGVVVMGTLILGIVRLGAAATIFASIAGQITLSVIVDHFGLFGVARVPFGWPRFVGVALMVVALLFIFRGAGHGAAT